MQEQFKDAALVLLGHGTTLNPASALPVLQHAGELGKRRLFSKVRAAFWKQEPHLKNVLGELTEPQVFIVPFFLSEGFFSDQVIPQELGFAPAHNGEERILQVTGKTRIYCRPIGTDQELLTKAILARAQGTLEQFPFPRRSDPKQTSLFLAGHGTARNANSRKAVEQQTSRIARLGIFADVQSVFMEEEPGIPRVYELAGTKAIVVVPYFISDGLHVLEDIPVLLGEPSELVKQRLREGRPVWRNPSEKRGKWVWYTPSVGSEPALSDAILELVRQAARRFSIYPHPVPDTIPSR